MLGGAQQDFTPDQEPEPEPPPSGHTQAISREGRRSIMAYNAKGVPPEGVPWAVITHGAGTTGPSVGCVGPQTVSRAINLAVLGRLSLQ
jgi:hypothetical protein